MIIIASHHNGPPVSGHGGVTAGRIAELVDPLAATVRLHAPIPLESPLVPLDTRDGATEIRSGDTLIATARPLAHPLDVTGFEAPPTELVARAEDGWPAPGDARHLSPTCFGCGPDRLPGDGLLLRPGPMPGTGVGLGVHATRWVPVGPGETPPWLTWAALDCASAGPLMGTAAPGEQLVTGELTVEIRQPVTAGSTHVLMSRRTDTNGRRTVVEAALLHLDGSVLAVAVSTWFRIAAGEAA